MAEEVEQSFAPPQPSAHVRYVNGRCLLLEEREKRLPIGKRQRAIGKIL
jgi:hypothetical protein